MSAGCKSPIWRTWLMKIAPLLFSKCPGYNMHWRWDQVCWCIANCNGALLAVKVGGKWRTIQTPIMPDPPKHPFLKSAVGR
jgi:hypothetical protein